MFNGINSDRHITKSVDSVFHFFNLFFILFSEILKLLIQCRMLFQFFSLLLCSQSYQKIVIYLFQN